MITHLILMPFLYKIVYLLGIFLPIILCTTHWHWKMAFFSFRRKICPNTRYYATNTQSIVNSIEINSEDSILLKVSLHFFSSFAYGVCLPMFSSYYCVRFNIANIFFVFCSPRLQKLNGFNKLIEFMFYSFFCLLFLFMFS